jgi:hypothetical protein
MNSIGQCMTRRTTGGLLSLVLALLVPAGALAQVETE